jgi:TrmH family RNA methyltransferase
MGSIYRVPFVYTEDLEGDINKLKGRKIPVFAAHLKGTQMYDEPDYAGGCAFLIGNEGNGLTDETADMADTYIRIPMEGSVESLNAGVAASLLSYEAYRQRRKK